MAADVFDALADPVRRGLLRRLSRQELRVVDLAAGLPISRPAVSRHLRVLTEAGLVAAEDRGRERHYRLQPAPLAEVAAYLEQVTGGGREPRLPVLEQQLDALATEVRRTSRERRTGRSRTRPQEETA